MVMHTAWEVDRTIGSDMDTLKIESKDGCLQLTLNRPGHAMR